MVGDSQIGKTSLMVKYVEGGHFTFGAGVRVAQLTASSSLGSFDEDYIQVSNALDLIEDGADPCPKRRLSVRW